MIARKTIFVRWVGGLVLCAMAGGAALAQSALGVSSVSDDALSLLSPRPLASVNPLLRPSRDYRGLSLADWMLYPSLTAGAIFDDNLFLAPVHRVAAVGTRLHPSLVAQRDAGIHKTTIYGSGDFRLYPAQPAGNAIDAQAGVAHIWEAQRDLVFKLQGEYDHVTPQTSGGLVLTPTGGIGALTRLQSYDQYRASAAVQKGFDRLFIGLAGDMVKTTYASLDSTGGALSQAYRDNLVTTVSGRGGYWVSPAFYAYTEAAGNFRDYANASYGSPSYNSRGYRVVAGLGSDRISLFRGEIYGGYQQQLYDSASSASPVYGGKLYWYPTRAWTVSVSLDETFSDSSVPTPTNPRGNPARLTSARLNVLYQLARDWSASLRGGYDYAVYLGSPRRDDDWMVGTTFAYDIYRNIGLALDYSITRINSNAAFSSYSRQTLSLGLTYKY